MRSNFSTGEYNLNEEPEESEEKRILLHMDIDYFFAQVEILKKPSLKGKPVVVGHKRARKTKRGVVLTCSYEARKYGVHSGQPMKTALELCPDAIIVQSSYKEYRDISDNIMQILKDLGVPMRQSGIDEAYVDITFLVKDYKGAKELAIKIKKQVFDKVQLTVSMGIGPTLKLAKIGSDYNKPDGITIITPDRLDDIFNGLPLEEIPGIGKKTAKKLREKGFETCDQLLSLNKFDLTDMFGSVGGYYYNILHAKTSNRIKSRGMRKSISHSRTFVGDAGDIETSREYYAKLFSNSFDRLIEGNFETKTVGLRIRFNDFETISRAQSLSFHTKNKEKLYNTGEKILEPHLNDPRGIRLIGVGFYNLRKVENKQMSLNKYLSQTDEITDYVIQEKKKMEKKNQKTLNNYFS